MADLALGKEMLQVVVGKNLCGLPNVEWKSKRGRPKFQSVGGGPVMCCRQHVPPTRIGLDKIRMPYCEGRFDCWPQFERGMGIEAFIPFCDGRGD